MNKRVIISIAGCIMILLLGFTGKAILASFRKPPAHAKTAERLLRVEAVRVQPSDVPVVLIGFGEVRTLNTTTVTPEVTGRIVEIHPNLEVGMLIPKGETLFVIDPRTYEARVREAGAAVAQAEASLSRLEKQFATDQDRLATLERTRDLARSEYERRRRLMEDDDVGTQSGVDTAEQAWNAAQDAYDLLNQAVTLYPHRIEETRSALGSARANEENAQIDLQRTTVVAPFNARVKSVSLEAGQLVGPAGAGSGAPVLELADDSILELSVPLDSRDARQSLQFDNRDAANDSAWFSNLRPVPCTIHWTEDPEGHCWEGMLDRVKRFEPETRTLTVAIRVERSGALSKDVAGLPLVEGMFCAVEIPGLVVENAYRLPNSAVSFEETVYVSDEGRLRTVPVTVSHRTGDYACVTAGLNPGDIVVTTRLTNPLESTLLDVRIEGEPTAVTGKTTEEAA
jgi:multidrug efflux pump subunit AcrA (membrane-fusion protein)